jgi:hypothetical protein
MTNPLITEPVTIQGSITATISGGTVNIAGTIPATIIGSVNVYGTVGAAFAGTATVTGSVSIIGTVPVTFSGTSTVTIIGGTSEVQPAYQQNVLASSSVIVAPSTVTYGLNTQLWGNLVLDYNYLAVTGGTIQTAIYGVEPVTGAQTSPLVTGSPATVGPFAQRLLIKGPLGGTVQAQIVYLGSGTATVTMTAQLQGPS